MKLKLGGEEVEVKQIEYSAISEPWAQYHLEGGKIVRVKVVLMKVFEVEGKTNDDGTQAYYFQTQALMAVDQSEK
jgi:hypothetical protein